MDAMEPKLAGGVLDLVERMSIVRIVLSGHDQDKRVGASPVYTNRTPQSRRAAAGTVYLQVQNTQSKHVIENAANT